MAGKMSANKVALYERAREAIDYLMGENGHTTLTKSDFAVVMATRHGRVWLKGDGTGNRRLVEDVCNLTRDQADDEYASAICCGFVVSYAPNLGGMTLLDPSGEMALDHMLHMLSGDIQVQQKAKTTNRRRVSYWNAAGHQAFNSDEHELGRVAFQIEREIDATGMASDSLVAEFLRLISDRGFAA